MDDEVQNTVKTRIGNALPALLGALVLVLIAVIIAEPWNDSDATSSDGLGMIAQVSPDLPSVQNLETGTLPGELAPNFRLEALNGEPIELASLRGRPIMLNFWATWCFACVSEMPAMQRVADDLGDHVVILGVNTGESTNDADTFAENNAIVYPLLVDPDQHVTRGYDVRAMPTSLFIDSDGVVRSVRFGAISETEMVELLTPLINSSSAFVATNDKEGSS